MPGNNYEFSQPIQLRFNELISGVRSDVAVKIFGDDMSVLEKNAQTVAGMLQQIQGASEVKIEQTTGLPMLTVQIDREKLHATASTWGCARHHQCCAGGGEAGIVFEGDKRFDIQVRLPEDIRNDVEALSRLPIALPKEQMAGWGSCRCPQSRLLRRLLAQIKSAEKMVNAVSSSVQTYVDVTSAPS